MLSEQGPESHLRGDFWSPRNEVRQFFHADVCGPFTPESLRKTRYSVLFVRDELNFRNFYFLKHKSEVHKSFKQFKQFTTNLENECSESGQIEEASSSALKWRNGCLTLESGMGSRHPGF